MPAQNTRLRWVICFIALPVLWIAWSLATDLQAVLMIPAAVVVPTLSALIALGSGVRGGSIAGYFIGTAVMLGVTFFIAMVTLAIVYCDGLRPC